MDTNTQVKPVETPPAAKAKKPIYKRWWAIALAAVFVIGGISQVGGGDDAKPVATSAASAQVEEKSEPKAKEPIAEAPETTQAPAPKPKPAPAPAPAKPTMTRAQEQAIGAAEDYLNSSHFSESGLIDQLKYEGYSAKDAKFAVTHVKVSWNEQAAGAAEDYLNSSHFSRSGLIEQLKYEGYTHKQAVYGVNKAGL
jgi:Host cell surface-exposed lipoprotein